MTYLLIGINIAVYVLISLPQGGQRPDPQDPALRAYLEVVRETLPPQVSLRTVAEQLSAYDIFVFRHGYKPGAPEWSDLFFSLFLHGGLMHLVGNMLFLWIYGDNVEHRLGRFAFLLCYLLTGVAATLFFSFFAQGSLTPLVGASGAISGVLGFYFLWFPRNVVRMFVFLFPFIMNVFEIPARIVLGIYLVIDNLLPFFLSSTGSGGVAHGAHIGGFVAGLAMAQFLKQRETSVRPPGYRKPEQGPASLEQAIGARDFPAAASAYFALPSEATRRVLSSRDSLALGEWLAAHGHPDAALVVFRRHLRDYPSGPEAAAAHLGLGLVQLEHQGQAASAYQHFLDALDLDPDPETARRAQAALAHIAGLQKYRLGRS